MTDGDVTRLYAHEMAARLRAGDVTARELAVAHLERAERQNHALNAWLCFNDGALDEADAADARLAVARGDGPAALDKLHPLLGIPVALKDLVSVKGGQATAGSRILEGYLAPYDAHITERLRDVGAVILGKTNMDEFAMGSSTEHSAFGPTSNPWDLETRPRRQQWRLRGRGLGLPRAARHRHGHRRLDPPARGAERRRRHEADVRPGLAATGSSRSRARSTRSGRSPATPGTPRRSCTRSPAATSAISTSAPVPVPGRAAPPARRRRGGRRPQGDPLRAAARVLPARAWIPTSSAGSARRSPPWRRAGAIVEEVSLPHTDYGLATYYIVAPAEASANLARYDGIRYGLARRGGGDVLANYLATRGDGFGAEVKRRIMLGTYALSAGYYDAYYLKAQKVRTLIKQDFDKVWEAGFDAIVAPTSASVAFRFGARLADPVSMYVSDACTLPVNMAGLPGVSIPCGLSEGLPVGLQLIGEAWSEAALFRLARGYEAISAGADWRGLEPAQLALADDPNGPTPAERAAALAGAHA